jgi:hypothetical protein
VGFITGARGEVPGERKPKAKAVPLHATEALEGRGVNNSYSFSTSALDGCEWSASPPGKALSPGKGAPVPIVQEDSGPHSRSGHRLDD